MSTTLHGPTVLETPPGPRPGADRAGLTRRAAVGLVAGREITTQLRRRELWASLVVMMIVLSASLGLQKVFGGGGQEFSVGVLPAAAEVGTVLDAGPTDPAPGTATITTSPVTDLTAAAAALDAGDLDAVLTAPDAVLVLDRVPGELTELLGVASAGAAVTDRLGAAGLDDAQISAAMTTPPLQVSTVSPDAERQEQRMVTAAGGVLALFFLMFMFGQGIAQGVLREKSSRVVEVLLAKVDARTLLAGKVLGIGVVVLVQMTAIVAAAAATLVVADMVPVPADVVDVGLSLVVWVVPGFFLMATLWSLAGALVSRAEDLSHAAGPVSFLQTLAIFAALVPFTGFNDSLTQVLSWVPGVSWAVMPLRMATESVPLWESALSMGLMLGAIAGLLHVGGKVYLGGVLQHGGVLTARSALRLHRQASR